MKNEDYVRNFLKENGFTVNDSKKEEANGIDIIALKDGNSYLIEVKKAVGNKSRLGYQIKSVSKKSEICDLIAVVTPNKNVFFLCMKNHLKNYRGKTRGVSKLVYFNDDLTRKIK